ncbi:MAG: hypothetical protein K2P80_03440 [Beijerinckiaceae bacterium]|nr:hypothetical protein [Beijerinckiaceae bacterium]
MLASIDANLHAADLLAVLGAFQADLGAFPANMPVMLRFHEHEMRRSPTDFGTRHHEPEMIGRDMLAARFETMAHRGAKASLVAFQTFIDAFLHQIVMCHDAAP